MHTLIDIIGLDNIEYCPCGSGILYSECCKINITQSYISKEEFDQINILSEKGIYPTHLMKKIWKKVEDNKCLEGSCSNNSINSHIFPKNKIKREYPHGIGIDRIDKHKQVITEHIKNPKSKILTFKGWCKLCDDKTFKLIDNHHLKLVSDNDKRFEFVMLHIYRELGYYLKEEKKYQKYRYSLYCHNMTPNDLNIRTKISYLKYNSICKEFFYIQSQIYNNSITILPGKYGEIDINCPINISYIDFPLIKYNGKELNNFDKNNINIISPLFINIFPQNGKLIYFLNYLPGLGEYYDYYLGQIVNELKKGKDIQDLNILIKYLNNILEKIGIDKLLFIYEDTKINDYKIGIKNKY